MKRHLATSWRVVAAIILGIAGAMAGCNVVVDAGAYHVVYGIDGSAVLVDGSATGADGAAFMGSEGGSPVLTGIADGSAGIDGGSREGGGNGACGSTPLPTGQAFQQLVNACVLSVSCDPVFFPVTASDCITNDYLATFAPMACLATITSCADFYNCQNYSVTTTAQCPDTSSSDDSTVCDGNIATNCFYSESNMSGNSVYNCTALAGSDTCAVYTDDTGDTQAACELGTCSDTDSNYHCLGSSQLYTCVDGLAYGFGCPQGSACGTLGGSTSCYYNTTACSAPSVGCTSAGALTECVPAASSSPSTYQVQDYNCAAAGLACETDDAGGGQCVSPGCEQSTACAEGCDPSGMTLTVCVGGLPLTYDCVAKGFTGCGTATPTGSTTAYSYCYY